MPSGFLPAIWRLRWQQPFLTDPRVLFLFQVDLLACLFDRNGHKAEVVVLCFDRIVDKSAFGALLRVLPEAARVRELRHSPPSHRLSFLRARCPLSRRFVARLALPKPTCSPPLQVEVCQRLGWNNLYDSLYPLGHYVLDLEMMDDVKVLQKLLDLNMRLSEGEANQVYGANEEGSILRSLAFNGQPISGPIACVELFEYLVSFGYQGNPTLSLNFASISTSLSLKTAGEPKPAGAFVEIWSRRDAAVDYLTGPK